VAAHNMSKTPLLRYVFFLCHILQLTSEYVLYTIAHEKTIYTTYFQILLNCQIHLMAAEAIHSWGQSSGERPGVWGLPSSVGHACRGKAPVGGLGTKLKLFNCAHASLIQASRTDLNAFKCTLIVRGKLTNVNLHVDCS